VTVALAQSVPPPPGLDLNYVLTQVAPIVGLVAERLDFAERMLAERRERKLGAGQ